MNDFERVKQATDIARYISHKTGLSMKPVGQNMDLEECPFCGGHDCFRIDPQKQLFKCFQCEAGGDVFSFLEHMGYTKAEALREVAEWAGVRLRGEKAPKIIDRRQKILIEAVTYYQQALWQDGRAGWLRETRGWSQPTLDYMKVGYADGGLTEHLLKRGYSKEALLETGLAKENGKGTLEDFFPKGVYVFPHMKGHEVLFLSFKDPQKKYKFQLPSKYRHPAWRFYNQGALSAFGEIIVVEGESDLLSWIDAGFRNVVGLIGQVADYQIRALKNFCKGKHIYLCLDDDEPGHRFTRKIVKELSSADYHIRIIVWDGGAKDIDEFLRGFDSTNKRKKAKELVAGALHPIAWEIHQAKKLATLEERLRALKKERVFERIADLVEVEQEVYIEKLVGELGFTEPAVRQQIEEGSAGAFQRVRDYMASLEDRKKADPNELAELIYKAFSANQRGRFFKDREGNVYLLFQHKIYKVGSNRPFNALMKRFTGLLPTREPGRSVWESLASEGYLRGKEVQVLSWLYTDRTTTTIYANLNSDKNTILKIAPKSIEEIPNGTNRDDVLLNSSRKIMPFTFLPDVNIKEGLTALKELIFDNLTCEREQRYLVLCWFLSCFLIDFSPYSALMKFSGSSQSGKTTAAKLLSLLIYGDPHLSDPTASAAYTLSSQNPLLIIDDLENEDMTKTLSRFLRLSATRGSKEKRAGGTDTETVEESPRALVLITAIEPFTRSTEINRTYDIEFSSRYKRDEFIEDEVITEILRKRDIILSSIIKLIAYQVLPNLDRRRDYNIILKKEYRGHSKERTNEFLAILMLILDAVIKYIPYYDDDEAELVGDYGAQDVRRRWIKYQDEQARETESEINPMSTLFNMLWKEYKPYMKEEPELSEYHITHPDYNLIMRINTNEEYVEFEASSHDLFMNFVKLAKNYGIRNPYTNPKQLGVRLVNEEKALREAGWEVIKKEGCRYWKIVRGEKRFLFRKGF